jgi:hypothetical protein
MLTANRGVDINDMLKSAALVFAVAVDLSAA